MTQFLQNSTGADTRKGALFKKRLTTSVTGLGGRIIDAGISSHFSDVFDGNFNFFPIMAVDADGESLEEGKAPIGTDTSSVSYLLQFPSVSPPPYGSAELYSANLHLHMEDINYRNSYSLPDIEIYKFKKSLPYVGEFGDLRTRTDSNSADDVGKPERLVVGSSHYSGGPSIIETFSGTDLDSPATFKMPSLYRGAGNTGQTSIYYSTLEEGWEIDRSEFDTWTDRDDTSGANNIEEYEDNYAINWEGYGKVIKYQVDSRGNCRPTGSTGPKTTWGDDPDYFLGYWNWDYSVQSGYTTEYRGEKIHDKNNITSSISQADAAIDVNLKEQLTSATMTPDNTFFDDIWYTDMTEITDTTASSKPKIITSISHPHFSTDGGAATGQVGRLYTRVDADDTTKYSNFKGDKTNMVTICLSKKIPKPLPLARQNGTATDLNKMRIRIKFMINSMAKSHRSGNINRYPEAHVAGCNIIRSFTAMLATRPVGDEHFGTYINRMNSGDVTSKGYGKVDYNGQYDADSFSVQKDIYNHTSYTNIGNSQNRINFYNGVSLMRFTHGRGFILPCDTSTDAGHKFTRIDDGEGDPLDFVIGKQPRVGQYVTGTGVPEGAYVTGVNTATSGSHFATISANFTSTSNDVNLVFEDGRLDEGDIGENQSNSDPDDGTFTMFHTGHPDGSTRWNNWDAIYQCSGDYNDVGACDYVPFVHKEAGASSAPQYLKRDGTTFTQDHDKICSSGPSRKAFVKLEDDATGMRLEAKQWYYLDAYLNQDSATVTWVISDMDERVINYVTQAHSGSTLSNTSKTHHADGFPCYLTLWVNNIKVGAGLNGTTIQNQYRGEKISSSVIPMGFYDSYQDVEVDVLLGNVSITNFEPNISNNTYIPGRKTVPNLTIAAERETALPDLASIAIGDPIPEIQVDDQTACIPSYLSWGAHTDIWTGSKNHVFLGGFTSSNAGFEDPTDSDKRMKYGTTSTDANSMIRFFTTATNANQPMGLGCLKFGNEDMNEGVNVNPAVNIGYSAVRLIHDSLYIDSFTQKGFFTINNPVWAADAEGNDSDGTWTKKENPMFSTKVLEWDSSDAYKIRVAQPDALQAFVDDDFVIYRAGYTWANTVRRRGIRIKSIADDLITLGVPKDGKTPIKTDSGGVLCSENHIQELYICPQKYWLICELYNETADNHKLSKKEYTHTAVLADTYSPSEMENTKGLTFNETKYSDSTLSSNQWFHLTNSGTNTSLLETKIDYGLGSYSDEKSQAYDGESGLGYINKVMPFDGENIIDIGGLTRVEQTRLSSSDENLTFLIKSSAENEGGNTIVTTKYPTTSKHPSLTYIYRDLLPTLDDFKVKPYELDPYYPEFEWKTNDDDLWYGFIILDNEIIEHQYHKAIMHIPFNEEPSRQEDDEFVGRESFEIGKETFAYTYVRGGTYQYGTEKGETREIGSREFGTPDYSNNLKDILDIEGLAGNCLRFTGNDWDGGTVYRGPIIEYPLSTYGGTADRGALSVVAHFTVDSLSKIDANNDDKGYIIDESNDAFSIWVDSTGKVNASVKTDDATTTCTLISAFTVPVGTSIPTNVILTVDNGPETGNCKLYVNGKLEDQTGRKTTDGSSDNWKDGQVIEAYGTLRIGSEWVIGGISKNVFNGKLEELVIYSIPIYPINPRDGKITTYRATEEFTEQSAIAAGRPINAKLFIKDYHNIRGTTTEEVTQSSQVTVKKSGLGLKTDS